MADYYPLIAKAIAGLDPSAPGESRRALYDRARAALIAQLRGVQPPLSESEITRERLALEEAIRKVESEGAQRAANKAPSDLADIADIGDVYASSVAAEENARIGALRAEAARVAEETARAAAAKARRTAGTTEAKTEFPDYMKPFIRNDPSSRSRPMPPEVTKPVGDAPRFKPKLSLPPISALPEQNEKKAIAFRPSRRGPLELIPDSSTDLLDLEQTQLYARMRAQLTKLLKDTPTQEQSQIEDVVNDFLEQPSSWQAIEYKKVLWLCGNALRIKLDQHKAVKDDLDPHYDKLPDGVAGRLEQALQTWNVFVLGDADLSELDAGRFGPQERQTAIRNIEAAKPIIEPAAIDRNITTDQTGRVLEASLKSASLSTDNIHVKQAQILAEGTSKNFVGQVIRRAYLFCEAILDPQNDADRALASEYKKGAAKKAGEATVAAVIVGVTYGATHAASFLEFVVTHADSIKNYISIAMSNDQLIQVVDVIKYASTSLSDKSSDDGAN